jgi:ABC-type branched-subunit amino acid transport system permease subunit
MRDPHGAPGIGHRLIVDQDPTAGNRGMTSRAYRILALVVGGAFLALSGALLAAIAVIARPPREDPEGRRL